MAKRLKMQTSIEFNRDSEFQHPEIKRAVCKVAYTGKNRNGSYISKDAFEGAINSIVGIPVVGEYYESEETFGGHGGKLIIDSQGFTWVETTKPYGFVDKDANPRWESYEREDGTVDEYLVVDLYLWTGRYPELDKVEEIGSSQSMEIMIEDGDWVQMQDEKDPAILYDVFKIDKFYFSALCILGSPDMNPDFYTEPCFEDSDINVYSIDDGFNKELGEMKKELEELKDEKFEADELESELESKEGFEEETKEEDLKESNSILEEDANDSEVDLELDSEGEEKEQDMNLELNETSDDVKEVDYEKLHNESLDKIEELEMELSGLKDSLKETKEELESYRAKERAEQEDALFEVFDELLKDSEEYEELKINKSNYSVTELETSLHILRSKATMPNKFSKKKVSNLTSTKIINKDEPKNIQNPYEGVTFNK